MLSLNSMCTKIAARLSLARQSSYISSFDSTWIQVIELLNIVADDLTGRHDWSVLIKQWNITISATNYHSETLPTDYMRLVYGSKLWRSSLTYQPLSGPIGAEDWQSLTIQNIGFIPGAWRLFGGTMNIYGLSVGETVKAEYVSKNWNQSRGGSTLTLSFGTDDDVPLLPDILLIRGAIFMWKRAKGFDYGKEEEEYEEAVEGAIAEDREVKTISTAGKSIDVTTDLTWPGVVIP